LVAILNFSDLFFEQKINKTTEKLTQQSSNGRGASSLLQNPFDRLLLLNSAAAAAAADVVTGDA
jgi:hypothetical protein